MTDKLILVHTENGFQTAASTNYYFLLFHNFQSLKSVEIGYPFINAQKLKETHMGLIILSVKRILPSQFR